MQSLAPGFAFLLYIQCLADEYFRIYVTRIRARFLTTPTQWWSVIAAQPTRRDLMIESIPPSAILHHSPSFCILEAPEKCDRIQP